MSAGTEPGAPLLSATATATARGADPAAELAASAAAEWSALVSTAVVGTDRRMPPPPELGWQAWATATDPAVEILDRAAAVVVARRAGARPVTGAHVELDPAPVDARPPCPPDCAARLQRLLGGEHDVLLPEWFDEFEAVGAQLPWILLPSLLLRGRRHPELDAVVRRLAAGRASWLAEAVPELGVRAVAAAASGARRSPPAGPAWSRPVPPPDSGAAVTALVQVFVDGLATWAAAAQLRLLVAAVDPRWLPALVVELSRLPFHPATERTRSDVLGLAEFRAEMLRELGRARRPATPAPAPAPARATAPPVPDEAR